MKLQLYRFKCAQCEADFKSPKAIVGSYGEFILRGAGTGEIAYLNAFEDETYNQVDRILKANKRVSGKSVNILADALRNSYGDIACDPDAMGKPFKISAPPRCPCCGGQNIASWEEIDPPEFLDESVRPVSHLAWNALSEGMKARRVDEILQLLGY